MPDFRMMNELLVQIVMPLIFSWLDILESIQNLSVLISTHSFAVSGIPITVNWLNEPKAVLPEFQSSETSQPNKPISGIHASSQVVCAFRANDRLCLFSLQWIPQCCPRQNRQQQQRQPRCFFGNQVPWCCLQPWLPRAAAAALRPWPLD